MSTVRPTPSLLDERIQKKHKLLVVLLFLLAIFLLFFAAITHTALTSRHLPAITIQETNRALRGAIVSADGFRLAFSQKLYKAMVNTYTIDPNKKELFIRLFSIYSGIDTQTVRKELKAKGNVILSWAIDANRAKYLKDLARKLRRLKVFVPYKLPNKQIIKYGLSITESGEMRLFPYRDMFAPLLGYMRKTEEEGFTRPLGVKGLEKYYQENLQPIQNGLIRGERDIGNTIILDGKSLYRPAIDGMQLTLHIPLSFQKRLEHLLDIAKKAHRAKEVIAIIMEAESGHILALGTSNRFNPTHIHRKDYPSLNVRAVEYTYEPGSVMKPIIFSLLLQKHKVNPLEIVRTYNGHFRLGSKTITDEHKAPWLSAENVIVYSSNIGISQLAQRLDGLEYIEGLRTFGLTRPTGIDLPYEHRGIMPHVSQMQSQTYKSTVSYGYGIRTTLIQLVRAYNVFNNHGRLVTPKIVAQMTDPLGHRYPIESAKGRPIIHPAVAYTMQKILHKVVTKGTATKAQIPGLFIAGKTGTAHIASQAGGYAKRYNSTFIGFANDTNRRYTIGILVHQAQKPYHYFAAMSAVPTFRKVVELMVDQGFLTPDLSFYPPPPPPSRSRSHAVVRD